MRTKPVRPHARRLTTFGETIASAAGAIDLASIMVGVIVIGVIAGTVAASVFAVIPWSQDAAAKQSLDSVRTAEAVNRVQASRFTDFEGLRTAGLIQASTTVNAATDVDGSCYVAVSASASGAVFLTTNVSPNVETVTATTATTCLAAAELRALIANVETAASAAPAATAGFVQTIAGGGGHSAAIDSNGKLWSWGRDNYGQLGNDTGWTDQATPVAVLPDRIFKQVAAGSYHTVALDSAGKLWSWGLDNYGQLGDDAAQANRPTPQAVLSDRIFKQVAAGGFHTVALDSDGKLWSWGSDGEGQLGDSAALADQPTPKAVLSDRIFKQVTAGSGHTVALDSTGKLWSWGIDSYGQLGNDTALANQSIPVAVLSDLSFSEVSTNGGHAVAIDSNDKLWSWGYDFSGQLGNDTAKTNQTTPVAVLSDLSFSRVAAGDQHTMAIESTGKLWSWGSDGYGQLGDSVALTDQSTPVVVSPGEIFSQVFAGAGHTVAIDSTGKLWSWGWDGYGQLGNDTALADRSTPVAVAGW